MDTSGEHRDPTGRVTDGWRRSHRAPRAGGAGPSGEASELPLRNPASMLTHLGRHLGWHARTFEVNAQLEQRLAGLDRAEEWLLIRGLPVASVELPIPFVLLGPVGAYILQASRGYWIDEDVALMSRAAAALGAAIRDYPDPVRPCIVILDGAAQERQHFTGTGEGPCWVVSDGRLDPWLSRFRDHGFSEGDIVRLRTLGDPARIRETDRMIVPSGSGHDEGARPEDYYFPG
jgi:hypothetical protein